MTASLQARQHFSRKLKWDPSDFSGEKFAGGYCLLINMQKLPGNRGNQRKRSFNSVWNNWKKEEMMVSTYKKVDTYDREEDDIVAIIDRGAQAGWKVLL
ncbi:hypothetical protein [Methylovulum miyakonense]|uniref:hypothetical protein n=1 Tax=Methylovulum miyakonense TaxID=645578 RepID=UPI0003710289|nr:hypothetical protein [Methylovulum miyakonense]